MSKKFMDVAQCNSIIAEQKRKVNMLNDLAIDWEHLKNTVSQILNNNAVVNDEYKEMCKLANVLCDNMEVGIKNFREIIPTFNNNN